MWLATSLLGNAEGVIRLPAVIASGVLALTIARMTARIYHDQPWKHHAAFVAAALVFLTPAYQLPAILMTIDGPYIACWALASYFALLSFIPLPRGERVAERSEVGRGEYEQSPSRRNAPALPAFALFLGLGFLYKYTILLILPGLVAFLILNRKRITFPPIPATAAATLLAL
ncbi:MAG: glycosyltransferase family 39 protein, partial [Planctomycetota bacterium]